MSDDNSDIERTDDGEGLSISRRDVMEVAGASSLMGLGLGNLATVDASALEGGDEDRTDIIREPFFLVDKNGDKLTKPIADDTELFDPLSEGPPQKRLFDYGVEEYTGTEYEVAGNTFELNVEGAELFLPGLVGSRRLATKPPEGYDPEDPKATGTWPALTWGDYKTLEASAELTVLETEDGDVVGTNVDIDVEGAIDHGQYTIWVVKLDPEEGVLGFHPLGNVDGGDNTFRVDENGDGGIERLNRGGPVNGFPGFKQPEEELEIAADLTEEKVVWLAAAYHYDDQTWDFYPGPNHLVHFRIVFNMLNGTEGVERKVVDEDEYEDDEGEEGPADDKGEEESEEGRERAEERGAGRGRGADRGRGGR